MNAVLVPQTAVEAREPRPPAGWPLAAAFLGFPLWWALGFSAFVWIAAAVPMTAALLLTRRLRLPRGIGLWALFLGWMLLSATRLEGGGSPLSFAFRLAQYAALTVLLVYVYNLPRDRFPARRGVAILVGFWVVVVVGGYLGLLLPGVTLPSLAGAVLPAQLAANEFVAEMVRPQFSQVMDFLGYDLPRPAAPFNYTNHWGSAYALLLPFVLAYLTTATGARRTATTLLLAASLVPAVVSVNRGMWLSIGVGVAFLATQTYDPRLRRVFGRLAAFVLVAAVVVPLTPLGEVITDRLATPHSNNARADLMAEVGTRIGESPLLGYGSPRPYEGPGVRPPVGTQGMLWYILFSHGIPALLLFLGWLLHAFARSGPASGPLLSPWVRMSIVIALVQMPFYGLLGAQLSAVGFGVALALREADRGGPAVAPRREPEPEPAVAG